ncbi:hypothetical protein [uncultured Dysosmobacter sp.]|uniref:hypothetical protein n=1 Tax=uncultured Dysosmobacter sp. TaxID=2591384 RepID=UPI0026144191|nr:hypothetical protein [uncultured Dysosmobacter sp.]
MEEKQRKRRDFRQNVAIALLSVSAVILFAQTQLYNLGVDIGSSYFDRLTGVPVQTDSAAGGQLSDLAAPVRVAVTGTYGRYANVTLTTADQELFSPLSTLLCGILGSAQTYTTCGGQEFLDALSGPSVYYDFLSPLPLSVIAGFVDAEWDVELSARRLVVSAQGDSVVLYLLDDAGRYLRCATAVSAAELEEAVSHYELGNDMFAFDGAESNSHYQEISPLSLLPAELPALPCLTVDSSLSDTTWLLNALGFNPNTQNRYQESSGTEVIMEGERALYIRPDNSIYYQSGGEPFLTISAAEEVPTLREAAAGTGLLLNALLSPITSDAGLYLESIRQNGAVTVLCFAYQVSGVPIRLSGGCAAEVTLTGNAVSALSLRFRQYAIAGEDSLLLPLRQAVAIAAKQQGAELTIGYADNGGSTISATWLAD